MINFVDRFSKIKEGLPSCTLIVILSLKQGVGIGTLQHEKESSIRLQYKNLVKNAEIEFRTCPKSPLVNERKV